MSFVAIKSKFHCAIDGQGLVLQGAPDRPAYAQAQAPVYGNRFASGDRSYNDLSQWWYFVQTSWTAGFKDIVSWLDDAKYYFSTNIDAWSENGAIKLSKNLTLDNAFSESIVCGGLFNVAGTVRKYIGTADNASNRPQLYEATQGTGQSWTEVSGTTIDTGMNAISQLLSQKLKLWLLNSGSGVTDTVENWDGTTFTDQTAYIDTLFSHQSNAAPCGVVYGGVTYIFRLNFSNTTYGLVKTSVAVPTAGSDYTKVFEKLGDGGIPISAMVYDGKIYYLVNQTNFLELWAYDIADAVDTLVQIFKSTTIPQNYGLGDKLLVLMNGKMIITLPPNEIWELNGSTLTRLFAKDTYKSANFNSSEANAYLGVGCVISENKAWWGNLMYDGEYFHNTFKSSADSTTVNMYPIFSDVSDLVWYSDSADNKKLYYVNPIGTVYKGTADKNFIVFNNFDLLSGIDKLAYSVTILFKPLLSGQSITVEYFTGELTGSSTWTTLGTASFSVDAGVVTDKTFYFGASVIYKKIWFRVKMAAGGANTPTMNDIIMEYLPVPTFKKNWSLNINCGDEVKRLDGMLVETVGRELKGRLERSWWTKSILDFQDLDYATTLLDGALTNSSTTITVDSTKDFPEQGRLHVDDEEITYTSKTPTTFLGCTRGTRSTRAVAHSDNTVINNAYKVILTDLSVKAPILLEDKEIEYTVGISLREV